MFCSKYDADKNSSYMDGIPVKISEQYKPPKKISVPSGVLNRHTVEIEEYDFRLEKSMIKKMDEWRELRKSVAEKRRQRIEMEDQCGNGESKNNSTMSEAISRLRIQSPEPTGIQPATPQSQPSATVPVSQQELPQCTSYSIQGGENGVQGGHSHSDPILTPVPVPSQNSYNHQTVLKKSFNISDFESDTSSPFDNMELKTLNDIEELAHVLQPNLNSDNCDISCPSSSHPQPEVTQLTSNELSPLSSSSISKKTDDTFARRINGMNSLHYSNYNNLNSNHVWPHYNLHYHNNHSQHLNHNHHNYLGACNTWAQSILSSSYNPNIQSYVVQRLDHLETDHLSQQHHPLLQHHQVMSSKNTEATSKSVPDIIKELALELKDKRASEKQKTKKILNEPARPASIGPIEEELEKKSSLPNPFNQLSLSCQQLCLRLSEMGFPLPRVARAVHCFGDNETKVLEFLLQIQHLEEGGCPPDRAEMALVVNKYNFSEAVRFLESLKQLLDLGFVEKNVMEALEKYSNDRDKALESLIS